VDLSAVQDVERRFRDAYNKNGVDRTLIRACLAMSPQQRLQALEERLEAFDELRKAERLSP
jgi:hypothetical protein